MKISEQFFLVGGIKFCSECFWRYEIPCEYVSTQFLILPKSLKFPLFGRRVAYKRKGDNIFFTFAKVKGYVFSGQPSLNCRIFPTRGMYNPCPRGPLKANGKKWNKLKMTPRFLKHFASMLQKLVPNSSFSEEQMKKLVWNCPLTREEIRTLVYQA